MAGLKEQQEYFSKEVVPAALEIVRKTPLTEDDLVFRCRDREVLRVEGQA